LSVDDVPRENALGHTADSRDCPAQPSFSRS
jgi:hypothetical protein